MGFIHIFYSIYFSYKPCVDTVKKKRVMTYDT